MTRSSDELFAAAERVELTPPVGGRLGGFGCRFEANNGSLDPLNARMVLFSNRSQRLLWVSCDLLGFSTVLDSEFRRVLSQTTSVPESNILISCTHTHSAPVGMPARGPSGIADMQWIQEGVFARVAECAAGLETKLKRVASVRSGTTVVHGFGYNRQDESCPIDERLITYCFVDAADQPIATFTNYTLHPVVIGETNLLCSADYPGHLCAMLESQLGGVALFLNGSCGDVDPTVYRDEGRQAGTARTIRQIGETLARAAIASLEPLEGGALDIQINSSRVLLPLDPPEERDALVRLRGAFANEAKGHEPGSRGALYQLEWADDLLAAIDAGRVPSSLESNLTAARVGPMLVVTFPFEIYSEIGLEIRRRLEPHPVVIAAYTGGLIGYVVTSLAKRQGGYGAALSHRYFPELLTAIGNGSDTLLINRAVALAQELHPYNKLEG